MTNELFFNNENNLTNYNFGNLNFTLFPEKKQPKSTKKTIIIKTIEKNNILVGNKRNNNDKKRHSKHFFDNKVRRIKVLFKNALFEFINSKIKNLNLIVEINGKIYIVYELLNIKPKRVEDTNIISNLILFDTQIMDFLSEDISDKFTKYPKNYNKVVIDKILENANNQNLIDILNMTYLDCLKYYRKDEEIINDDNYSCLKRIRKEI